MRLRDELRTLMDLAEGRAREAAKRVSAGEIPHFRQMDLEAIRDAAQANLQQLADMVSGAQPVSGEGVNRAAADVINYVAYLRERLLGAPGAGGGIPAEQEGAND